jgi:hypothetical protein
VLRPPFACALAVLLASSAATALAQVGSTTRMDAAATLADDGTFHVVETYDIELRGGLDDFEWEVGLAADQSLVLEKIVRLGSDGTEHPLVSASEAGPDRYFAGRSFARVGVDQPGQPIIRRQYRIEYRIVNALAPAWDIPAGPRPLDALEATLRRPLERWSESMKVWRQAWPEMRRRYRLDHDVMFPFRGAPTFSFDRKASLHYDLAWSSAWRLLGSHDEVGKTTPDVDFRVQRTFERVPPDRPAAVDFRSPTLRLGAIAAVPGLGLVAWLAFMVVRGLVWGLGPRGDAAFFESRIASQPPELIATLLGGETRPRVEDVLLRLAADRKMSIEVTEPSTEDRAGKTRLRLLVDRGSLHPMDRDVVDAVFGETRTETTSDDSRQRCAAEDRDLRDEIPAAAAAHVPPEGRWGRAAAAAVAALLFVAGVWYAGQETTALGSTPFLFLGGIFGAFLATGSPASLRSQPPWPGGLILLLSLGVASGYVAVAHFVTNTPIGPNGAIGLSLMVLSGFVGALGRGLVRGPRERLLEELWRGRRWAAAQLKRARPRLLDAWIPRLEALGLGPDVQRWRESVAGGGGGGEETDYTALPMGAPFTGNAKPLPDPGLGWSDGFHPDEA